MKHMQPEQQRLKNLFSDGRNTFSFPLYQRAYEWGVEQCDDLWEDLINFAFPEGNPDNDEYFFGNIVTCRTSTPSHFEIVDGQQRSITLTLLMRALYEELHEHKKSNTISECIWLSTEDGEIIIDLPRINLTIEMDRDKDEFPVILALGHAPKKSKSHYAKNYRFFQKKIAEFKKHFPAQLWLIATRLLENCYVNNIVIDDEEHANQLFLTINDRGMSLTPADIFKGKLILDARVNGGEHGVNTFIERWDALDARCKKIFKSDKEMSPVEFAFFLYVHRNYLRLRRPDVLRYYSANANFNLLQPETLSNIEKMTAFLASIKLKKSVLFDSPSINKKLYILFNFPGDALDYLMAAYFFAAGIKDDAVSAADFEAFLDNTIAFFVSNAILGKGYALLKPTKSLSALQYLISGDFPDEYRVQEQVVIDSFHHFSDIASYAKAVKIILYWWTFQNPAQELPPPNVALSVEHIFATKLASQRVLESNDHIDLPGNLALLEKSLNEKAQNFGFADKAPVYLHGAWGKCPNGTFNAELQLLAQTKKDFVEPDIMERNEQIISAVVGMLDRRGLLIR